ncbi:MAG: hypothetical protein AB4042_10125 [Leptolyngbyaceae cyanobacterium]
MPILLDPKPITVRPNTRPNIVARLLDRLGGQWYPLLCQWPSRWPPHPGWARHPLLLLGALWLACGLWNLTLAVVVALGGIVAIAVYLIQLNRFYVTWNWSCLLPHADPIAPVMWRWGRTLRQQWHCGWTSANRPLTLSLLSGLGSIVLLLGLGGIWQSTHSFGLMVIVGAQTGAIAMMGRILWQQRQSETHGRSTSPQRTNSQQSVNAPVSDSESTVHLSNHLSNTIWIELGSAHPPTRLMAIYRVTAWIKACQSSTVPSVQPAEQLDMFNKLTACLRLMLTYETHPTLRQAIQDALRLS